MGSPYIGVMFLLLEMKPSFQPHALATSLAMGQYDRAQWLLDAAESNPVSDGPSPHRTQASSWSCSSDPAF